jgi:hypothetical protein
MASRASATRTTVMIGVGFHRVKCACEQISGFERKLAICHKQILVQEEGSGRWGFFAFQPRYFPPRTLRPALVVAVPIGCIAF